MADAREQGHHPAHGLVRDRRPAGRRGDDDAGPVPVALPAVTLYHAAGCPLCDRALEVVRSVQQELGFELELVDIGGDPELEERYRVQLPVVEIDGEPAFTYFVDAGSLRERLTSAKAGIRMRESPPRKRP